MKTIIIALLTIIYTFFTWPLRIINRKKSREEREAANYKLLRVLIKMVISITGIKISIDGKENIKKDTNYLIIANHKSDLDSLILIWLFEEPLIFIGKEELKKTPFISTWFKEIGSLFIERDNIRQSAKVILEGVEILKGGKSIVIFPEGKRIMEDRLGEFKNGSFKLAIKSKVAVLPVAIVDSYKAFEESKRIKSANIKINVGEKIDYKELGYTKTSELCEHTKLVVERLYRN
ncbi:1-acyl-sn-glycerol-3-phosphate acyltransferase [Clostridium bornimense]|uniref:lysophospholipid acyltransferase family protein n=1 Tax=Clostridium bornimense TaxID=1216932 RepID=UPI001C12427B|nr:lysophospholipid acyltransferase family protein [Clostridium bornimense]MBU5316405.1 1-acyl-sn-glycerol-3-phosphate acyltransferase [Clostridium bornimense]